MQHPKDSRDEFATAMNERADAAKRAKSTKRKIYWSRDSIPALEGLTPERKAAAVKSVVLQVWGHWQVWVPFAVLSIGYVVFFSLAPSFPYRFPIVLVSVIALTKIAALPSNSYYQHYLSIKKHES